MANARASQSGKTTEPQEKRDTAKQIRLRPGMQESAFPANDKDKGAPRKRTGYRKKQEAKARREAKFEDAKGGE